MCGIAGAFSFSTGTNPVDRDVAVRVLNKLAHRGPDGEALWTSEDGRAVLGHRRLAIIDTGPSGAQPMADASGRWIVTFNGEIYNYQALRSELEERGYRFATSSDTEVLINAIDAWGEAGLSKLRGMFAFALWDSREKELWLARDPYGIKPLYLAERDGTVWFSSEARALAACAPIDTRRDPAGLVGYYLWGHVPEPFSWWAGIRMLRAGHLCRIRNGAPSLPASAAFASVPALCLSETARPLAPGELRSLMLDTIRHHLVADVPIGVFLSAGMDSSVIAALATEIGGRMQTVTMAFKEFEGMPDDEAPLAEQTARVLGSEHTTVRVSADDFEGLLDDFLQSMDQPTIDGLNTYLVSRAAAQQGLKVVLSGLGGDELFGGYPSFAQLPKLSNIGRFIPMRNGVARASEILLAPFGSRVIPPKFSGVFRYSDTIVNAYLLRRSLHLENELDCLLDESWINQGLQSLATQQALNESVACLTKARASDHLLISNLESCWYMRNQLLRDTDWSGMAHGLEVRVPYVDSHLIRRLGPAIGSETPPSKSDLLACANIPLDHLAKRPKTGFSTPLRHWFESRGGTSDRGLRGWAVNVHGYFRTMRDDLSWTPAPAAST